MLELVDVSHHYLARKDSFDHGLHHVLNRVSLSVMQGDTLGIIGRNGAGKTTLLRLMAGIIEPRQGRIVRSRRVDRGRRVASPGQPGGGYCAVSAAGCSG
jgi:ABC-type polysaccharide/polyol phosphate transport system ATPase subunit